MSYIRAYLIDSGANKATMSFPLASVPADIDTFLSDWSMAGAERAVKVEQQTITPTAPIAGANVDYQVKCLFVFGQTKIQFSLLSPKEVGEVKHDFGRVLTTAEKSLLLGDWKTVNGYSSAYSLRRNRFLQHL